MSMPEDVELEESRAMEDDWEGESGLPDDFDFWITKSRFGYIPEYTDNEGNPVPLLLWYGESPDIEIDGPIPWSIGKGWEILREGKLVRHRQGRVKFLKSSMYQRMIDRVVKQLNVDMRSRGMAKDATVWEGLGFHMKRETIDFGTGILADRGGKADRLMPVAFLGDRKQKTSQKRASEPAQGEKAESKEEKPADRDKLMKKLKALARTKDRAEFQSAAMDMDEVLADDALMADICDDSDKGFWARARSEKP